MDPFASRKPAKPKSGHSVNPFAKALAETERSFSGNQPKTPATNPFSEALARTGGNLDGITQNNSDMANQSPSPQDLEKQRLEMEKQQKKEALRRKLHDQVNPVSLKDVYDSKEKRVKEELEKTRKELKLLAQEIAKLRMDVDIAAMKEVVNPGQDGTYYVNFFHQLRAFIILLRKKVKSARTWMNQMNSKKKKKKRGKKPGLEIGGSKHEQGKTAFDTMHHERSTMYSGN